MSIKYIQNIDGLLNTLNSAHKMSVDVIKLLQQCSTGPEYAEFVALDFYDGLYHGDVNFMLW